MTPKRAARLRIAATVFSAAAHLALLAVLARQAPVLRMPDEAAGPPEPIIPVLLLPRTPPAGLPAKPAPMRLHRRPPRVPEAPSPVPPLPAPAPKVSPSPAPPNTAIALHPAPLPQGPTGDLRAALRASPVGCANQDRVGLTRSEREHCQEEFGKGAKTAPSLPVGTELSADKREILDRAARDREADYRYKHDPPIQSAPSPGAGASAHDLAKSIGDDRPDLKIPLPR